MVRLIEEGVSLAPISRATGIPIDDLAKLDVARKSEILSSDEIGQKAGKLANRALDEGMRILDEGTEATKLRLITSIAAHPLRRMQTDTSEQFNEMKTILETILMGPEGSIDDDEPGTDGPPAQDP